MVHAFNSSTPAEAGASEVQGQVKPYLKKQGKKGN
jgi:hypothetical protein